MHLSSQLSRQNQQNTQNQSQQQHHHHNTIENFPRKLRPLPPNNNNAHHHRCCSSCQEEKPTWVKVSSELEDEYSVNTDNDILCDSCGMYWVKHGEFPSFRDYDSEGAKINPRIKDRSSNRKKANNADFPSSSQSSALPSVLTTPSVSPLPSRMGSSQGSPKPAYSDPLTPISPDLSKLTERQQIAYLLNQSVGSEATSPLLVSSEQISSNKKRPFANSGEMFVQSLGPHTSSGIGMDSEFDSPMLQSGTTVPLQTPHGHGRGKRRKQESAKDKKNAKKELTSEKSSCFYCKQDGIVGLGGDLYKCKVHQCGKHYHWDCVASLPLARLANPYNHKFNCPLHYCSICGISGDGRQSVHCSLCPTAYHVSCMPIEIRAFERGKETRRTGLIYCTKHRRGPNGEILEDAEPIARVEPQQTAEKDVNVNIRHSTSIAVTVPVQSTTTTSTSTSHANESSNVGMSGRSRRITRQRRSGGDSDKEEKRSSSDDEEEEEEERISELSTLARVSRSRTSIQSILSTPFDDVMNEILQEFSDSLSAFQYDQQLPIHPKQRQKRMERIRALEERFKDSLLAFAETLQDQRELSMQKIKAEYGDIVNNIENDWERNDNIITTQLIQQFKDWANVNRDTTVNQARSLFSPIQTQVEAQSPTRSQTQSEVQLSFSNLPS